MAEVRRDRGPGFWGGRREGPQIGQQALGLESQERGKYKGRGKGSGILCDRDRRRMRTKERMGDVALLSSH